MTAFDRASIAVLLGALALLSLGGAALWSQATDPSDGTRLGPSPAVWRSGGVVATTVDQPPDGLRTGDLVIAVEGRSLESWARSLFAPSSSRPVLQVGQILTYTVVREGRTLDVPVTLRRFPLAANLAYAWGIVAFALAFLAVAMFVFANRPADPGARTMLLTSAGVAANALGSLGLEVSDLVGRGMSFWLFQTTNVGAYLLFWSAAVHFALVFPRPQPALRRHPWVVPVLYVAPVAAQTAYVAAMGAIASSTLDWIGRSNVSLITEVYLVLLLVAVIAGYRSAPDPTSRQQVRWVALALVASGGIALALGTLPELVLGHAVLDWNAQALFGLMVPFAIAAAILRHRLFGIEVIVNRALVYGVLTACVVATYVLVVGYLGALFETRDNLAISVVAASLVALLFQPLREWLQRSVNRLMYGERDSPYEVIARLGHRLEATLAPEAVLPTIVESAAQALKLPHASLWLVEESGLRLGAAHGSTPGQTAAADRDAVQILRAAHDAVGRDELDARGEVSATLGAVGADLILPLSHRGELLGALALAPRAPGEALSRADRMLLRDLAGAAGAAVHAVRLTLALRASLEELRRSRELLVAAQEEERQRVQRDLHDGLGPTLASLRLRIEGCLQLAKGSPSALVQELEWLDDLVGEASADIRRLVYALRPPSLDQLGLVPALRQHVDRFGRETGLVVRFVAEGDPAVGAAAEAAIFRVAQEALHNVQRHARASQVDVNLHHEGGWLVLRVSDDGVGLGADDERPAHGAGLRSMRERAEQLGGTLRVEGMRGRGTDVLLRIPAKASRER